MIRVKIDVTKIDKTAIHLGKQGKYADFTLMDNRDGTDQYGNDGFVVQDLGKERREAGEKGPIIGNWKHVGQASQSTPRARPPFEKNLDASDDIPF